MPAQILDNLNREELIVMPSLDDFSHLSQDELSDKDGLVLKHKLVMREGEHNGVIYNWDELKSALASGEDAGIFYDHDDSCSKWLGSAKNISVDDKSHEIFADLHIIDSDAAKKLKAGAKWGVSPTIDAEKVIRDGESYAMDPKFISYSLVLRPAVRETMLNSEAVKGSERRLKSMSEKEVNELTRKVEDLTRKSEDLAKKSEDLKTAKDELKGVQAELEEFKNAAIERESNEVLSFEKEVGFTKEAEATERLEALKQMTSAERKNALGIHQRYAKELGLNEKEDLAEEELSAYTAFLKKYRDANKGATIVDAAAAWEKENKMAAKPDELPGDKKKKYPYPEKKKLDEAQADLRQELSQEIDHRSKVNKQMLDFMHAQENR